VFRWKSTTRLVRAWRFAVRGHSLHYGPNAPPPASEASVPGVASEDKSCSNDGNVGGQTSARTYTT
jgi:hypothetical protein